jgi:hypothetical protein
MTWRKTVVEKRQKAEERSRKLSVTEKGGKARIKVSLGLTATVAYQSARLDVGIEQECPVSKKKALLKKLWDQCEEELHRESEGIQDILEEFAAEAEARKAKLGIR